MDIHEFERIAQRYLNGQATDEDLAWIEQWFRQTEGNDYQLTGEKRKIIAERLLPRLHAIAYPQTGTGLKRWGLLHSLSRRVVRIAAVFIIVALTGIVGWIFHRQLTDRILPVAQLTIKAGPYEIKRVQLPDRTMVTLDTGASIRFPVEYRWNKRAVSLEGKAFFEVAKNKDQSFVVHAPSFDVTVLGTSFVVTDQKNLATVSVVSGKVRVANEERKLAELDPGLQVLYDKQLARVNLQAVDVQQAMSWTRRSFSFAEVPLEQVLKAIAKKWNIRLVLPATASGKQFSGDFADDDNLNDMMKALSLTTGIHWRQTEPGVIVVEYPK